MVDRHTQALSFGSQSGVYEAARPGYPRAAVDWVLELLGEKAFTVSEGNRPLRFADIGAGTGKLTRVLREVNDAVVAIDPDPNMLVQLRAVVPGVEAMEGRGEEIPLSDGSCSSSPPTVSGVRKPRCIRASFSPLLSICRIRSRDRPYRLPISSRPSSKWTPMP